MSLQYLLDGYNIINQMPGITQKKLEDRRQQFLRLLELAQPQGSSRNKLTVVFDGRADVYGNESRSNMRVIFTSGESADTEIKRLVDRASNKKQVVVVTDDREIQYYVRAAGASVVSVKEFITKLSPGANKSGGHEPKQSGSDPKRISKTDEHKITSEFTDIWLKKDKEPEK